jgi:hypothetical protein
MYVDYMPADDRDVATKAYVDGIAGRATADGERQTVATKIYVDSVRPKFGWRQLSIGMTTNISGVFYGNGLFIGMGNAGFIETTQDGLNWG